jgi:hypothetical protein
VLDTGHIKRMSGGRCQIWESVDYRDYDINWLSEIVIHAVSLHQVGREFADVDGEERV